MKQNRDVSMGCSGVRDMIKRAGLEAAESIGDVAGGVGGGCASLFQKMPARMIYGCC